MTREIKFRGLSVNGSWYYGLLSHTEDKKVCGETGWFISNKAGCPFAYQIRPETRGQSTGLLDKNGKEIFEFDLIKWSDHVYEVRFLNGCWELWHKGDPDYDRPSLYMIIKPSRSNVEIIGNIYENKELL